MSQEYFIRSGGRTSGPHSIAKLHSLARNGEFSRHCEVSTDKHIWVPAEEVPGTLPETDVPRFTRPATPKPAPQPRGDTPEGLGAEVFAISLEAPVVQPRPAEPPSAGGRWFYTRQGQEVADPVDWASLQRKVSTEEISLKEHVWTDGYREWMPVEQVPGLVPIGFRRSGTDAMAVATAVIGAIALLMFTAFMIPIALKLRNGQFAPASHPLLAIGAASALLLALLAIVLGHVRLAASRSAELRPGMRSAIVVGLIGGYTVVIMEVVLTVVVYLSHRNALADNLGA